jgi:hypothetical protein
MLGGHFPAPYTEDCQLMVASQLPLGGFVVLAFPQPVSGQSGRRKPLLNEKFRRCLSDFRMVRQPCVTAHWHSLLMGRMATGTVVRIDPCAVERSISRKGWAQKIACAEAQRVIRWGRWLYGIVELALR